MRVGFSFFMCIRTPNSEEALKLMVSSYSWKIICGWINHSCKVTNHKILVIGIGNYGSKSARIDKDYAVKEQRVDGYYITLN